MGPALQTVYHRLQDFRRHKLLVKSVAVSFSTCEQVCKMDVQIKKKLNCVKLCMIATSSRTKGNILVVPKNVQHSVKRLSAVCCLCIHSAASLFTSS